jgi:hypothetical protein
LRGKAGRAEAVHPREPIHAAPTPQVAPMMNSLRFMTPPHCCGQRSIEVWFIQNAIIQLDEPALDLDIKVWLSWFGCHAVSKQLSRFKQR